MALQIIVMITYLIVLPTAQSGEAAILTIKKQFATSYYGDNFTFQCDVSIINISILLKTQTILDW